MPEYINLTLEIGGNLPVALVPEFLKCVNDDVIIDDIIINGIIIDDNKNLTYEDLLDLVEPLKIYGSANYGQCPQTTNFCINHGLSFVNQADSQGEYEADTTFFLPGMEEEETYKTDQQYNAVVQVKQIKPLIDLLIAYTEKGINALQSNNNPVVRDLIKRCLDNPQDTLQLIKQQINKVIPQEAPDNLPPLKITQ